MYATDNKKAVLSQRNHVMHRIFACTH